MHRRVLQQGPECKLIAPGRARTASVVIDRRVCRDGALSGTGVTRPERMGWRRSRCETSTSLVAITPACDLRTLSATGATERAAAVGDRCRRRAASAPPRPGCRR